MNNKLSLDMVTDFKCNKSEVPVTEIDGELCKRVSVFQCLDIEIDSNLTQLLKPKDCNGE